MPIINAPAPPPRPPPAPTMAIPTTSIPVAPTIVNPPVPAIGPPPVLISAGPVRPLGPPPPIIAVPMMQADDGGGKPIPLMSLHVAPPGDGGEEEEEETTAPPPPANNAAPPTNLTTDAGLKIPLALEQALAFKNERAKEVGVEPEDRDHSNLDGKTNSLKANFYRQRCRSFKLMG